MKKMSDFSKYTNKTKGAVMKFFNKGNNSGMPFGANDLIRDDTAAIISELGKNNSADDISFEPIKPATPKPQVQQQSQAQAQQQQSSAPSSPRTTPMTPLKPTSPEKPTKSATQEKQAAPAKPVSNSTIKFGIKDAIDLINSLPSDNTELVIPVVVKTLESANIHLDEIIDDADKHEKVLETRCNRLIEQIEDMEAKVAQLSDQVMGLNAQLEDITHVRELLSLSFEDDPRSEMAQDNKLDNDTVEDINSAIDGISIRKNV